MGDIARQRTSCTLTPLSALLCVAALVLLFSLIGIFTRPPNLLAAFWPANAVLLGCMVRYPRLATPAGWAGGILGFFLVLRGILGKWKLTDRVLVNWLSPNTPPPSPC
ncbi:hypothetical protein U1437_12235, partial [Aeromonas caviae]